MPSSTVGGCVTGNTFHPHGSSNQKGKKDITQLIPSEQMFLQIVKWNLKEKDRVISEVWAERSKLGCWLGTTSLRKWYLSWVDHHLWEHLGSGKEEKVGGEEGEKSWEGGRVWRGMDGVAETKWKRSTGTGRSPWPCESLVPGFSWTGLFRICP